MVWFLDGAFLAMLFDLVAETEMKPQVQICILLPPITWPHGSPIGRELLQTRHSQTLVRLDPWTAGNCCRTRGIALKDGW